MLSLSQFLSNPGRLALGIVHHCWFLFSDKASLKIQYRVLLGRRLNLKKPLRFTEKLQWLKLYDRKPEYTSLVDKLTVKEIVASIIGKEFIIPTLGAWNSPEDIEWDSLPNRFVLKTTHGGGGSGVVICNDKMSFNRETAIKKLSMSMKHNIFFSLREWPYKDVPHRIIAEQLLDKDPRYDDVPDYKFYCFNGVPKVLLIAVNRFSTHNFNYYDMDFHKLDITSNMGANTDIEFIKPDSFGEMKLIAARLSKGFPHMRVDLFYSGGKIYFGELTFYDSSGFDNMSSDIIDLEWGRWITLPIDN